MSYRYTPEEIGTLNAENDRLRAVVEAADYYIDRLEAAQRRKVVRDMTEAMEWYKSTRRLLGPEQDRNMMLKNASRTT